MTHPTRSLFALDPASQKVRFVVQVTPDGWSEDELETMFRGLVPVLGNAAIPVALVVSKDTAFVVRFEDMAKHFDIDEVEVADVVAPYPLDPDPAKLFESVSKCVHELAEQGEAFASQTKLAKRVPELVPLLSGAELRERDGAVGIPAEQLKQSDDT